MVISIFLSLTWSFNSTIRISRLGLSPSFFLAYRVHRIIILASDIGPGLGTITCPFGTFALQRALSLQPALSGVPRYEIILHTSMRSNVGRGSTPSHILPHSRSPNFVCSNASEVFVLQC